MNPTQCLYRYSTLIDSINRMNSLANQMNLIYRNPFETTLRNAQFINNISTTALTSFKGTTIQNNIIANSYNRIGKVGVPNHPNVPGTFLKPSAIEFFSTLPVLPELDWILEEPEEVQEKPLDVITEYQIKEYLQLFIHHLELFHEDIGQEILTLQIDIEYTIKYTLTLKNVLSFLKYIYTVVYFLALILNSYIPVLKILEQYLNGMIMVLERISKEEHK